jgi:nucleotide-binding universal stress UspA family protein
MQIKEILLCVEPTTSSMAHVRVAAAMAASQGARLTALFVQPELDIPLAARLQSQEVEQVVVQQERDAATKVHDKTASLVEPTGVAFQWIEVKGEAEEAMIKRSRAADVVVALVAQPDGEPRAKAAPSDNRLIEPLIRYSGRPVLLVPAAADSRSFGKRVLITWDEGRESSRALHDALPVLAKADRVDLLTGVFQSAQGSRPPAGLCDVVCVHLAQHGIAATPREVGLAPGADLAEVILDQSRKTRADLIVMGAFGGSRVREVILGSITENVINSSVIPVLVSH